MILMLRMGWFGQRCFLASFYQTCSIVTDELRPRVCANRFFGQGQASQMQTNFICVERFMRQFARCDRSIDYFEDSGLGA